MLGVLFWRRKQASAIASALKRGWTFTLTTDAERVHLRGDDGSDATMAWAGVRRIAVVTTDEGPQSSDVFVRLESPEANLVVPTDARNNEAFVHQLVDIEGFDVASFLKAMTSAERAEFPCWEGAQVVFRGR
jgi:hypothetical protein